jgi:glycosyltransferase involved in cell wall biosynthesis
MRIAIDISTVLNFGTDIGSARYILNLVRNLLKIDKENNYVLFGRVVSDDNLWVLDNIKKEFPHACFQVRLFKTTAQKLRNWDRFSFPPLDLIGLKADVFHFPDYLLAPLFSKNTVLTIHDMSFYSVPQFNFDWFVKKYQKIVRKNVRKAKIIIADSMSTKDDIIRHLSIRSDKIFAIHLGADEIFKKLDKAGIDKDMLGKMGIHKKFILSVGTIEPRKNYVSLIQAFAQVRKKADISCVICGKTGWKSEATFAAHQKSPYKEDIKFIGSVSDEELLQLYNQAELLFYPSYFEGFGLPIVEAMACGLPVVASNTSSIVELVQDKDLLFAPEDIAGFSKKILALLQDKALRQSLSLKSIENASLFRFEKTARQTLEAYQKALMR